MAALQSGDHRQLEYGYEKAFHRVASAACISTFTDRPFSTTEVWPGCVRHALMNFCHCPLTRVFHFARLLATTVLPRRPL